MADRVSYFPDVVNSDIESMTWVDSRSFSDLATGLASLDGLNKNVLMTENDSLTSEISGDQSGIDLIVKKGVTLTLSGLSPVPFNLEVEDGGKVTLDADATLDGVARSKGDLAGVVAFDSNKLSLVNSSYQWTLSGSGTAEYYLEASGGGDPEITEPGYVFSSGTKMSGHYNNWNTLGSLASGEAGWGDNDSLGFNTVYVRLSTDEDPDSKSDDYVEKVFILTINGEVNAGVRQVFGTDLAVSFPNGGQSYSKWFGKTGDDIIKVIESGLTEIIVDPGTYEPTTTASFSSGIKFKTIDSTLQTPSVIIKPTSAVSEGILIHGCKGIEAKGFEVDTSNMSPRAEVVDKTDISFDATNQYIESSSTDLSVFSELEVITIQGSNDNDTEVGIYSVDSSTQLSVSGPLTDESSGASITISEGPYGIKTEGMWNSLLENIKLNGDIGVGLFLRPRTASGYGVYWNEYRRIHAGGGSNRTGIFAFGVGDAGVNVNTYIDCKAPGANNGFQMVATGSGTMLINCAGESNNRYSFWAEDTSSNYGTTIHILGGEWSAGIATIDCAPSGKVHCTNVTLSGGREARTANPIFQEGSDFASAPVKLSSIQGQSSNTSVPRRILDFFGSSGVEFAHDGFGDIDFSFIKGSQGNSGRLLLQGGWSLSDTKELNRLTPSGGDTININPEARVVHIHTGVMSYTESATVILPDINTVKTGTVIRLVDAGGSKGDVVIEGYDTQTIEGGTYTLSDDYQTVEVVAVDDFGILLWVTT